MQSDGCKPLIIWSNRIQRSKTLVCKDKGLENQSLWQKLIFFDLWTFLWTFLLCKNINFKISQIFCFYCWIFKHDRFSDNFNPFQTVQLFLFQATDTNLLNLRLKLANILQIEKKKTSHSICESKCAETKFANCCLHF